MEKTVNKVELDGFVGINPEIKTIGNGGKFLRFTLATSQSYKDKDGNWVRNTTWHNVVMWNSVAETAANEIKKGSRITLTGRINNRAFNGKDGAKRYTTEIIVSSYKIVA